MPTISMFYRILIRMFFRDTEKHHITHIHADYQGKVAIYSILDGTVRGLGCRFLQPSISILVKIKQACDLI
jgi:hypothetical protein